MKSLMRNLGQANRSGGKNKKEKVVCAAEKKIRFYHEFNGELIKKMRYNSINQ